MILGYTIREDGVVETIEEAKRGYVYTQAFILCKKCSAPIRSCGGPHYNSYCVACYESIKK